MRAKQLTTAVLLVLVTAGLTVGFSGGPPDSHTGAPGENNCRACHGSFVLNASGGSIAIAASAPIYNPGDTLVIDVDLERAGKTAWGFESTVLRTSNNTDVGTMLVTMAAHTQKSVSFSRQYIKHTFVGTYGGTPNVSPGWQYRWVAPAVGAGNVRFYVAGNAANNDGTSLTDHIYTTSVLVQQNVAPVLTDLSAKNMDYLDTLVQTITASDANGTNPAISNLGLPANAVFLDNGDGTAKFEFVPDSSQGGTHVIKFVATDGTLSDTTSLTINVGSCCIAVVGNTDCDPGHAVDISDLTVLIDHLFINNPLLCCHAEGNIDGDGSGNVDISDLTMLIDHLFINNPPLPPCS